MTDHKIKKSKQIAYYGGPAAALLLYAALAFYLLRPHLQGPDKWKYLLAVNSVAAATGCYLLSRRWVSSIAASILAGAVFGFGPFMLGLARFHPTAGLPAVAAVWLFIPAVRYTKRGFRWVGLLYALLPFAAIFGFFLAAGYRHEFPMPVTPVEPRDLFALAAPLVMVKRTGALIGFYHVPMAALTIGAVMIFKARRYSIAAVFCIGAALAFCPNICGVSPAIWLVLPVLCCSIAIGEGVQGLIVAGYSDRRWVLLGVAAEAVLAIVSLLMAVKCFQVLLGLGDGYGRLLVATARFYILGGCVIGVLYAIAAAKMRVRWLRIALLAGCLGLDIVMGARFIVDSIL